MFRSFLFVIVFCLLCSLIIGTSSCSQTSSETTTTTSSVTTTTGQVETKQETIIASTGGTISFSDNTSVSIPAGALASNMTITANKLAASSVPTSVLGAIYLTTIESLSTPATVTLKYDTSKVGADQDILVGLVGGATPLEEVDSSEVSAVQIITPESVDSSTGTITVKASHFSFVWAFCQDKAYIVYDFGDNDNTYLKPGDMLYALTGAKGNGQGMAYNGSWCPSHAAMWLGTVEGEGIKLIIESTVTKDSGGEFNGVQLGRMDRFKILGHIYMGARRPKGITLTDAQRSAIVKNAKAKLGWPYFYINFDSFGVPLASGILAGPKTGITCVALVEDSYNEAGIYNVSAIRQHLFFPIDQFNNTEPVKEITVKTKDLVKFSVYGVTRNNYTTWSAWRTYLDQENFYNLSVSCPNLTITSYDRYPTDDDPDRTEKVFGTKPRFFKKATDAYGYTHGYNYPYFQWVPASTEVGTYNLTFTLNAGANGTKTETMTINVTQ